MKKKLLLTLASVTMFALSLCIHAEASQTTTDFENGLEQWFPYTWAGGSVRISTAYAYSDTHSVEQIAQPIWNSTASIRLQVTSTLSQYELTAWVYVAERTTVNEGSHFGFLYDGEPVNWNAWRSSSSYVSVRKSEGYQTKGNFSNPVPYGLTLNSWHQVKVVAYTNSGKVSIWLDGNLIVDNWPAFNAAEHPDYYYISVFSSGASAQQYIDDVSIGIDNDSNGEIPELSTPFWLQWYFWTNIALGITTCAFASTTVYYRKKTLPQKRVKDIPTRTVSHNEIKVCLKCGASLPADSKFCGKCGALLLHTESESRKKRIKEGEQ